jgi:hypothetical protein
VLSDKIKFKIIFSDDAYLLQFLRIRKFNIESACESFEKYFLYRKKYEKWCKFDRDDMTKLWELFDTGYAYPLTDRDDEGKKIIFIQARKFDTQKFTSVDAIRLIGLIVAILMEEDETQISGISTISDFTGVSFSYFKVFSIRDIKDFADCAKNATVGREKENYFVNLPIFASFLFEIGRKAISEKLRQRHMLIQIYYQKKFLVEQKVKLKCLKPFESFTKPTKVISMRSTVVTLTGRL